MQAEVFHAFCHQLFETFRQLRTCEAVFCVFGFVHDFVVDRELTAWIESAADRFRQSGCFFQEIDVGNVIQIDGRIQFVGELKVFFRRHVRREHDFIAFESECISHHQLCISRTIDATTFFFQNLQDGRCRGCLHSEVFLEALVPGESLIQFARILTDAFFII